ncbi:MAG: hypothetical protein CL904_00015 [Dehalococcoidia bacterium]|nr:hypothetical protein [Dehalococcoidia bacterium]|tara:strand:+ start:15204 stop:15530 length:327 start_codon:yes stop_codon:yes gene_type:complete
MPNSNQAKAQKLIQDLILFFVKENYNKYLSDNEIKKIQDDQIESVVKKIYQEKKSNIKEFLTTSLKKIMGEDYIGDLFVNNICIDIFRDDQLCTNRIILEIKNYQKNI